MSTNNYQFNRARKLNRSARAESKQELGRCAAEGYGQSNQWQSIAALGGGGGGGGEDNFSRLKKSYATLRKSFRLQLSSDHKREFDFSLQQQQQQGDDSSGRRNLMGQLGSGAAKLLRGVYAKGQRAYNSSAGSNSNGSNELDSIRFTDGSFKVLTPTGHYGEQDGDGHYDRHGHADEDDIKDNNNNNIYSSHKTLQLRKSMADLEIEQRLRRSRRRVLPSAKYQAPASDRACEGLNMEELEEIKRDNFRMTLLKTPPTTTTTTATPPDQVEPEVAPPHTTGRLGELEDNGDDSGVKLVCSCKDIDDCAAEKIYFQNELDNIIKTTQPANEKAALEGEKSQDELQHYCTCASISSSFSSLDHLIEFENEMDHDRHQKPPEARPESRASGGCGRSISRSSSIISGSSSNTDSSSEGGNKIEDRLKAMFESMGHKLEFLSNGGNEEIDLELGNGCCGGQEELEMNPVDQQTVCVRLSPKAEQKQQQHDTKSPNQQQPKRGENIIKAQDQANNQQQQQQQQVANEMGEEEEDSSRSGCELLAASSLGGVNLIQNGQQVASGGQQQVSSRSGSSGGGGGYCVDGPASDTMAKSNNNNNSNTNNSSHKAGAYPSYSPQPPPLAFKGYGAIELASNNNEQQQLVACCAVNTPSGAGHQCKLLNAKQQIPSTAARHQKQHPIREEPKQSQDQNQTLPEDHRQQNTNAEAKHDAAKLLKCVKTNCENGNAQTTNKDQQHKQQQQRRPKQHQDQIQQQQQQEVMLMNRMGDSCACRQGCAAEYQQQQMMVAGKRAPEYPEEPKTMQPCDEHLYASISDPIPPTATSSEQTARQRQFQGEHKVDQNYGQKQNYHRDWPGVGDCDGHDGETRGGKGGSFFDKHPKSDHDITNAAHLNNQNYENSPTMLKQKPKRSLFGRLKNMIVPTGCRNNRAAPASIMLARANHKSNEWAPPHQPDDDQSSSQGDGNRRQGCRSSSSKWQKSATLTTRSTQNLIGSSFRYLSNSRKSINNGDEDDDGDDYYYYGGLANNKTGSRRPLTSYGFLTLGRRANNHQPLAMDQMFKGRPGEPSGQVGSRFAGSADSLPSADSGLSCSNLQTSGGSSDDTYALHHPNNNLYSRGPATASGRRPMVLVAAGAAAANINREQQRKQDIHHQCGRRAIGKAVAMVDCNPCAYDKEALVFKQGDTIDILERNQTGTWVGRCNGQTGHFKFINVTELTADNNNNNYDDDDGACEGGADLSDSDRCGGRKQQQREQRNNGGVYVTKLEIRSNNNNSDQIKKCKTGQEKPQQLKSAAVATIDRRSKSMNMISQQQQHQTTTRAPSRQGGGGGGGRGTRTTTTPVGSHLSGGSRNETIMSSLEQLLFAIGLAGEQVNRRSQPNHGLVRPATGGGGGDGDDDDNQVSGGTQQVVGESKCWSYLDVLNRGGINNLDSFSAIDDWHELEQIGIVDDEHQRRLLMAARIIRQASQAAKLDFVENYHHHRQCDTNNQRRQQQAHENNDALNVALAANEENTVPPDTRKEMSSSRGATQITDANMLNNERECSAKEGDGSCCHGAANEPIYVNLVRRRLDPGFKTRESIVNGYRERGGGAGGGGFERMVHGDGNLLLATKKNEQQHELANRMHLVHRRTDLIPPCDHHRHSHSHHYNRAELACSQTSPSDDGGREVKINSINQSDHYRPLCAQTNSTTTQETCLAESDGYYDDDNDYCYYDDEDDDGDNDDDDSRRDEISGHGQNKPVDENNLFLNRRYSSSIVVREATCSGSGHGCSQFINNKDLNHQKGTTTTAEVQTSSVGGGVGVGMIDGIELFSPRHSSITNSYRQLNCATAPEQQPMQPPQRRRIAPGCDNATFVTRKSNCDWPVTRQQQQGSSKDLQRPTINRNAGNHHTNDTSSNLKSIQINSKSAYDLRLDLSHFFS